MEAKDVPLQLNDGTYLAMVSIPDNAVVINSNDFRRSDLIFVHEIIPLCKWEMWDDNEFCFEAVKQNRLSLIYVNNGIEKKCLKWYMERFVWF